MQEKQQSEEYQGWKNYETWNVALWIGNDEWLWEKAKRCNSYAQFLSVLKCMGMTHTRDGVRYNSPKLDHAALDAVVREALP